VHSYYRRPLPERCVPFSSAEGRTLFREALAAGTLENFFPLAEQFHTQQDPAFCGLASLVVGLNALAIDPGRLWKGPWRWFGEELLDCCTSLDDVRQKGVTLLELGCLARCNGAEAIVEYADERPLDTLREHVAEASRLAEGPVLLAGYSRKLLDQTGEGHFSPLAGYHAGRDLALVLDVARFKYPPYWLPLELLHRAMCAVDPASGRSRGWLRLAARGQPSSLRYYVSCRGSGWMGVLGQIFGAAPALVAAAAPLDAEAALAVFGRVCVDAGLLRVVELRDSSEQAHAALAEELRLALRATRVYAALERALDDQRAELAAIVACAAPETLWAGLPEPAAAEVAAWIREAAEHPLLRVEIAHVRGQLAELRRALASAP
jgi:glutathione gamma-glutamylcysteinyltransferase